MRPDIASPAEWLAARKELLDYTFEGPNGQRTLLELFEGRRQLIVHHFMWVWDLDDDGNESAQDTGCPSCSATADNIGNLVHLHARDTTLVAASCAPYDKIGPFNARMRWTFADLAEAGNPWTPQRRGDYPGIRTFLRDGDTVFHTYTTVARGVEQRGGTHYYLDATALGRREEWEKPAGRVTGFGAAAGQPGVRLHDEYACR